MKYHNNLQRYREACRYTQAEIAGALGIARETYNRIENGYSLPNLIKADMIAKKLATNVYELWPCLLSSVGYESAIAENRADERCKVRESILKTSEMFLSD